MTRIFELLGRASLELSVNILSSLLIVAEGANPEQHIDVLLKLCHIHDGVPLVILIIIAKNIKWRNFIFVGLLFDLHVGQEDGLVEIGKMVSVLKSIRDWNSVDDVVIHWVQVDHQTHEVIQHDQVYNRRDESAQGGAKGLHGNVAALFIIWIVSVDIHLNWHTEHVQLF